MPDSTLRVGPPGVNDPGSQGGVSPTPTSGTTPTDTGTTAPGDTFKKADGFITTASSALGLLGKIGSFFTGNKDKATAAAMQQAIERTALQIQDAVNSGAMSASAGIQQLQALQAQAASLKGTPEMQNAGTHANLIIGQVLGNLQTKQQADLTKPFDGSAFTGNVNDQKARLQTGLTNYAGGTDLGKQFYDNSPLTQQALAKPVSPDLRLPDMNASIQANFPGVDTNLVKRPLKTELY